MSIENSYDPNEHRLEAMEDGSGFSSYLAHARFEEETIPGLEELPRQSRKPIKRHRTGHVRVWGDTAPRDGELEINQRNDPLTPEQQIATIHGVEMAQKAIADNIIQSIIDRVEREIPLDDYDIPKSLAEREGLKTILLKKYFDEKAAKKAARAERLSRLAKQ